MTRYKNPWHLRVGGPEYFEPNSNPLEYRDHLIYLRSEFGYPIWDVVKDGVCVTQLNGLDGARRAIDAIIERTKEVPNARNQG